MPIFGSTTQRTAFYGFICLFFGFVMQTFAAGDAGRGEVKAQQCVACHGEKGITSNPQFPNLAGQNATYLEMQLNDFKSGKRNDPIMSPIAKTLSDQDIADLALYYSNLTCPTK